MWFVGMFVVGFGLTVAVFALLEVLYRRHQAFEQQREYERWRAQHRATWR